MGDRGHSRPTFRQQWKPEGWSLPSGGRGCASARVAGACCSPSGFLLWPFGLWFTAPCYCHRLFVLALHVWVSESLTHVSQHFGVWDCEFLQWMHYSKTILSLKKNPCKETSVGVQQLRLCAPSGVGSIPSQGTEIPRATQPGQNIEIKWKEKNPAIKKKKIPVQSKHCWRAPGTGARPRPLVFPLGAEELAWEGPAPQSLLILLPGDHFTLTWDEQRSVHSEQEARRWAGT